MNIWWLPTLFATAILIYVAVEFARNMADSFGGGIKPEKLPSKLKGSIRFIEGQVCTEGFAPNLVRHNPYRVKGRPDLLFKRPSGSFVPVDHKRYRKLRKAFPDEIAQLSLYTWLLRGNNHQTESYGYIALETREGSGLYDYIEVQLLDDAETEALIERHEALLMKRATPVINRGGKCYQCDQKAECLA